MRITLELSSLHYERAKHRLLEQDMHSGGVYGKANNGIMLSVLTGDSDRAFP